MRETEKDPLRIDHMLEAISRIKLFLKNKDTAAALDDEILFFAIVKNIEIIGEAAFMLTKEFKEKHSNIPWRQIISMRHVLVHDYYRNSPKEVFKVCREDIPHLEKSLQILQNIEIR